MCRFIYTGKINITKHLAKELLVAADQYLLQGLKRQCEYIIAQVTNAKPRSYIFPLRTTDLSVLIKLSFIHIAAGHLLR